MSQPEKPGKTGKRLHQGAVFSLWKTGLTDLYRRSPVFAGHFVLRGGGPFRFTVDGDGLEQAAGGFAEGRIDQMNTVYPLDGANQIDRTEVGPPPVAGLFHKGEPPQPAPGATGGTVTAEIAAADFEVQQFQPVFQAGQAQKLGVFRQKTVA